MIPEILTLLLPIGKYLLASTFLALFYLLFYRGKTSYDLSRKYLVSIALVAILLSQFHIIVRTPPVKIVKVEASGNITTPVLSSSFTPTVLSVPQNSQVDHSLKQKLMQFLTIPTILLLIYGLVTLILIVSFILQYFKIIAMKRKGVVRESDGFEIVESADIPTPFSFCKTIFVGQNLTGNKRDVVIKHEQWHIRHHHYVDVMVMETLVRLFWFNPVLWWVRKELRNISEFQTDRSVLDEGHELYKYQTIILEEVMEQNPYLANGFNNSFTKKRFIRMKNTIQTRFTLMRRISIIPFLVGVFCLLCFTEGQAETRYILNTTENNEKEVQSEKLSEMNKCDEPLDRLHSVKYKMGGISKLNDVDIDKQILESSEKLSRAIIELEKANNAINHQTKKKFLESAFSAMDIGFNNVQVGGEKLSDDLCESITQSQIETTKNKLIQIKKELDLLKTEKSPVIKAQKLTANLMPILEDELVSKVLEAQIQVLTSQMENLMSPLMSQMENVGIKSPNNVENSSANTVSISKEESDSINKNIEKLELKLALAINELDLALKSNKASYIKEKISLCLYYLDFHVYTGKLGVQSISRKLYASINKSDILNSHDNLTGIRKDLISMKNLDIIAKKKGYYSIRRQISRDGIMHKAIWELSENKSKNKGENYPICE